MELVAQARQSLGKKAKNIRRDRKLPAVIFGKGMKSVPVTVELNRFTKVYKESGETTLVDLNVEGKKDKVLIKDVQVHPVDLTPIHVGFHKVNLKEKITAQIPVHIIGEETNALIKSGSALALQLLNEIDVEALPTDLPHEIKVDVSALSEVGQGITVGQLDIDREKVELVYLDDDELVVKLDSAEMVEEEIIEEVSEADAIAKVEASKELSEEEKAKRAEEEKVTKAKEEKK